MNISKTGLKEKNNSPENSISLSGKSISETVDISKTAITPNAGIGAVIDHKIESEVESQFNSKFNNQLFLDSLKEKLGITSPEPEFIDIPAACKLLNISKVTVYKRTKLGIYVQYRIDGSRKVLYKKSQLLSTLKAITKLNLGY